MNDNAQLFRLYLKQALGGDGMNAEQVEAITENFDKLNKKVSAETSFRIVHEAYASGDTDKAVDTINQSIQNALKDANSKHHVELDPRVRLKKAITRFNENIDKLAGSVSVNGQPLTKEDFETCKVAIPQCLGGFKNHMSFTAYAAKEQKREKFALHVVF